jgi:hypothetical protein
MVENAIGAFPSVIIDITNGATILLPLAPSALAGACRMAVALRKVHV